MPRFLILIDYKNVNTHKHTIFKFFRNIFGISYIAWISAEFHFMCDKCNKFYEVLVFFGPKSVCLGSIWCWGVILFKRFSCPECRDLIGLTIILKAISYVKMMILGLKAISTEKHFHKLFNFNSINRK